MLPKAQTAIAIVVFCAVVSSADARQGTTSLVPRTETLTIITYYPSPFGSYRRLEVRELLIKPAGETPQEPEEGLMFFSNGEAVNEKGQKLPKGIWIYLEGAWQPAGISLDPSQLQQMPGMENMNLDELMNMFQ